MKLHKRKSNVLARVVNAFFLKMTVFTELFAHPFVAMVLNALFWLLAIFAILGVIGFVLSGIFYLVAAGEESTMEKGKDGMKWSIIGIIVGLSGFIVMQAVSALLGGGSKTF